jgi:acyl carrier protein
MNRDDVFSRILTIFSEKFEMNPTMDDDLREVHEFDSIDAIELLREIEIMLGSTLTQDEKKSAMDIRTVNDIVDYVLRMAAVRTAN